ncbi:MAG: retropepsin-like domain-containing protein [Gammaproteobacteria bacterium]|nr:retropepsin-like domain-containing protein [Gammaproteobacteria bacterium]
MPRAIPVHLGPRRTNQGPSFVDCPPVIDVHLSSEKDWSDDSGAIPKHDGRTHAALIDTGAENVFISSELALELSFVGTSKATVHGFGDTQKVGATDIHIIIPSQNIVFTSRAAITDLGLAGHTFSLVLGRSFLRHCRLEVDGPSNAYRLWWLP